VRTLKKIDFSIQKIQSMPKAKEYVVLQAGKGKEDNSRIQVTLTGFSYIEGLIWDKYREYGNKLKSKISSNEWNRILDGFKTAQEKLSVYKTEDKLKDILKFDIISSKQPLNDMLDNIDEMEVFLRELSRWISSMIEEESYILVIKKKK